MIRTLLRISWLNLKRSIEAEMRAEELKEPLRHFEKEVKSTVDEVKSGVSSIRDFDPMKPDTAEKPGEPEEPEDSDRDDKTS